jgi:CheY-like chemotaxis protein
MKDKKVLVVEDEVLVAHQLRKKLEKLGYQVTATVGSGEEALESIRDCPPDLVDGYRD